MNPAMFDPLTAEVNGITIHYVRQQPAQARVNEMIARFFWI
jgi:hypothetical protein